MICFETKATSTTSQELGPFHQFNPQLMALKHIDHNLIMAVITG